MENFKKLRLCRNGFGKLYSNGRYYPQLLREEILDLNHAELSQRNIANQIRTSRCFVQKVLRDYNHTNCSIPHPKTYPQRTKLTDEIMTCIEMEKLLKPSVYASEIQERLLLDGVVLEDEIPSTSTINKCLRNDLCMTKKKIQQIPTESQTPENIDRINLFLEEISNMNAANIHCFDESSVIKTTCNRRYGNSFVGDPAFELQRYASNANYTVNLLHSPSGVDLVNVLEGPSNGNELLLFFDEAVNLTKHDGSVILERGDCVIMDNCGFHHGHFAEAVLTDMLQEFGVRLLFQPPYSPHFNTCELCFHQIKSFLRRNQYLAQMETEYMIYEACQRITAHNSVNYFKHCGYSF